MEKYTIDISAIDNNHETVTTIDMQAKFAMVASAISTYANKVKLLGAKHLGDIAIVSNKISIYLQSLNNGDFVGNFSHINEYFGDRCKLAGDGLLANVCAMGYGCACFIHYFTPDTRNGVWAFCTAGLGFCVRACAAPIFVSRL